MLVAGLAAVMFYAALFSPFLPGRHALLGHDYSLKLPQLLDGYFWFKNNGLFSVYWFSPSFCGGVPVFAHPINHFYSVIQFLTFWVGPLPAVGLSFLLFGLLGFWGSYVLMHRACGCSRPIAFLCAVLFLFNGFYWSKFLIGALDYHAFMLIPWAVLLLLTPHAGEEKHFGASARNTVAAGLVMAYMVYSGMQTLLPATLLAIVLMGCLSGLLFPRRFSTKVFVVRVALACLVALGVCAAKLSAIFYFVGNFPRTQYLLPQFRDPIALVKVLAGALWGVPMDALARNALVNAQFVLGRHEFELGVGPVPFAVITGAAVVFLFRRVKARRSGFAGLHQPVLFVAVCIMAAIPVALNLYTPGWNAFLKQVPVIGGSTQCVRWFSVYIPVLVLLTGAAMERIITSDRLRRVLALAGVLVTLLFNMSMDRNYYHLQQGYSGLRVQQAYWAVKQGAIDPHVTDISIPVDDCGRIQAPIARNDAFLYNHSQMLCYDSIFGYSLEALPFKSLEPGPVMNVTDGVFNIKNPACYVFPEANGCLPGDHFTAEQEASVLAFTHYRPFAFAMPLPQRVANGVTVCCLLLFVGYGFVCGGAACFQKRRGKRQAKDPGTTR